MSRNHNKGICDKSDVTPAKLPFLINKKSSQFYLFFSNTADNVLLFQVTFFSCAGGGIWSRYSATEGHTPRLGWSSSQSVLKSGLWSPEGFPCCVMCRWELQKRLSGLKRLDTAQWSRRVHPSTWWTVDPGRPRRRPKRRPLRRPSGPELPEATQFLWRMHTTRFLWSCQTYSCTISLSSPSHPTPTRTSPWLQWTAWPV